MMGRSTCRQSRARIAAGLLCSLALAPAADAQDMLFMRRPRSTPHDQKPYPSNTDREWQCPDALTSVSQLPAGFAPSPATPGDAVVHRTLTQLVPEFSLLNNTVLILVRRVAGVGPFFKYFSDGNEVVQFETWSCSKVFASMNAAGHLGEACDLERLPLAGLHQSTTGRYGETPLGDLVTVIVTYDETHPPYTSNAIAGWMEMVGGRARASRLPQQWLGRPSSEWLGANYGADPPTDLAFNFSDPGPCAISPDSPVGTAYNNTLSALTMAEMTKRLLFVRELPQQAFPASTWEDTQQALYGAGADRSRLFPGRVWGGMSANSEDALRLGVDASTMEARAQGRYRTFTKDGAGYSHVRLAGEITFNGYACYPDLADPSNGVEYIVTSRVSVPGDASLTQASKLFDTAMEALNKAVLAHKIQ